MRREMGEWDLTPPVIRKKVASEWLTSFHHPGRRQLNGQRFQLHVVTPSAINRELAYQA
jgi:hypothetical protein